MWHRRSWSITGRLMVGVITPLVLNYLGTFCFSTYLPSQGDLSKFGLYTSTCTFYLRTHVSFHHPLARTVKTLLFTVEEGRFGGSLLVWALSGRIPSSPHSDRRLPLERVGSICQSQPAIVT